MCDVKRNGYRERITQFRGRNKGKINFPGIDPRVDRGPVPDQVGDVRKAHPELLKTISVPDYPPV